MVIAHNQSSQRNAFLWLAAISGATLPLAMTKPRQPSSRPAAAKQQADSGSLTLQPEALCFAAQALLSPAEGDKPRRFSGVAYGGGLIRDHWAWDAVGFDLAGLQAATPMPLLLEHGETVGVINQVENTGTELRIAGELFTGIEPEADRIAAKADRGMPWQMSVGIFPDEIAALAPGAESNLNGKPIQGPAHIFRSSRVRETSICAVGADSATRAQVFDGAQRGPRTFAVSHFSATPKGAAAMTQAQQQAADAADMDTLKAENDALKAANATLRTDVDALKAQFAAGVKTARTALLKQKLGDKFSAEKVEPLLALDDAAFNAAVEFMAQPGSSLPAGFTREQAAGGEAGDDASKSVLVQSARQMFNVKAAA